MSRNCGTFGGFSDPDSGPVGAPETAVEGPGTPVRRLGGAVGRPGPPAGPPECYSRQKLPWGWVNLTIYKFQCRFPAFIVFCLYTFVCHLSVCWSWWRLSVTPGSVVGLHGPVLGSPGASGDISCGFMLGATWEGLPRERGGLPPPAAPRGWCGGRQPPAFAWGVGGGNGRPPPRVILN
jgi:hypothetical protein